MAVLTVGLGDRSYDITVERGSLAAAGDIVARLGRRGRAFILTDSNVAPLWLGKVAGSFKAAGFDVSSGSLPAGEKTKAFGSLMTVYSMFADAGLTRSDLVVTLGGGVIGDLGGFAAATYLRGLDYVQIPTTLLAQVDSSVGGKVAVDLPWGKNLSGAFWQPKAVVIDPDALDTLSDEYFSDGMAEVIKYGCIRDAELFGALESAGSRAALSESIGDVVYRCCDIKRAVVERDERDTGERMLLNFGHTYGHALERYYDYEKISHGAAVAVGMRVVCGIAEKKGLTEKGCADRITALCRSYGLSCEDKAPCGEVIKGISSDKKNLGGKLNVVLIKSVGDGYIYPTDRRFWQ